MCFHTQQHRSAKEIHRRFGTKGPVTTGTYNGFAHPHMTVITDEQPTVTALHQWGLIPKWAKDHSIRKHTLNARVETLSQKPSFRQARRCLVLVDAFFEWQWLDAKGKKNKNIALPIPITTTLPLLDFGMNGLIEKQGRSSVPLPSLLQKHKESCARSTTVNYACPTPLQTLQKMNGSTACHQPPSQSLKPGRLYKKSL